MLLKFTPKRGRYASRPLFLFSEWRGWSYGDSPDARFDGFYRTPRQAMLAACMSEREFAALVYQIPTAVRHAEGVGGTGR